MCIINKVDSIFDNKYVTHIRRSSYIYFFLLEKKIPDGSVSSSIPTKYQTVVIQNQEKKGFSSQAKRFPSQVSLVGNLTFSTHPNTTSYKYL